MKKQTLLAIIILFSAALFAQEKPYYHHRANAGDAISPETSGTSGTGANINVLYHKIYWILQNISVARYKQILKPYRPLCPPSLSICGVCCWLIQ
jgi:hypothetical protein